VTINWYRKLPLTIPIVLGAAIVLWTYIEPGAIASAEINLRNALVAQVPATLAGLSLAAVILILSSLLPSTFNSLSLANSLEDSAGEVEKFKIEGAKELAKDLRKLASDAQTRSQSEADRLRDAATFLLNGVYTFLLSLAIILALDASQDCPVAPPCATIGILLRTLPLAVGFLYLLLGTRAIASYSLLHR
jgi:hypothetical protein